MAVEILANALSAAVQYSVRTDSSADWPSVTNNTYFYDKTTRQVYYKDAAAYVVLNNFENPKYNLTAATNPTINDDLSLEYSKGSLWYNNTISNPKVWICLDNTLGAAVWKVLTLTDNDGNVVLPGGLQFSGGFGTANLTANTDNLLITGLASSVLVRLTSAGNFQLTGIVVPDSTKAYFFSLFNVGLTGNITFKNDDAGSTAENRFLLGTDVLVQPGEGLTFIYDPVDLRWRSPGKNI